jgi:2-polyprenyl-3-methyl-5-hydroxy-6-metoxy-1,4-benzoquinol methylase
MRCTYKMLPSADVIRADFDRIAACSPMADGRIEPSAQRLVAHVPLRSRVLEIGCGTGALARELATRRGAKVTAIDLSPRMIDVARVRTPASLGIEYHVADFLSLSPRGFDVVIATNTLHHLPLEETVRRMADAVSDTGMLLVADLFAARGVMELPYNGLSWMLDAVRTPSPASHDLAAAWDAHGLHDQLQSLRSLRRRLRALLPGVAVRRHLGWRYTAIWQRG